MNFELPKLPYEANSFPQIISEETFSYHHGKHLKTYIENMNQLLQNSPMEKSSLEEIVKSSTGGLFNNSAQAWNHVFYFNCISPNASRHQPSNALSQAIQSSFTSMEKFKEAFVNSAVSNFGSGWTWLVSNDSGTLSIVNTSNADTPIRTDQIPLLTVDVWEHAYYVDHRNLRKKYVESFFSIIDWQLASELFEKKKVFNVTSLMRK